MDPCPSEIRGNEHVDRFAKVASIGESDLSVPIPYSDFNVLEKRDAFWTAIEHVR